MNKALSVFIRANPWLKKTHLEAGKPHCGGPGQAILEDADGCVLDPRGRPLRYNQRDSLLNDGFIALGDPALPWREWM